MISPDSSEGPNIALITMVCGWTFLVVALLAVGLLLWSKKPHLTHGGLIDDLPDHLTILALVVNIALTAQTTWAIVDEGMDNHETEIQRSKFTLVIRVRALSVYIVLDFVH